ncbi:MAG: elongation factor P [Elusimicrobia bacterium RIFCSPLOWO2_02_FULL_39_32]|nr:MAG: elongation factor P [Elusimicrobia bacterium GWA2_38_7]OGR79051.1 MAG: elongation factor P [Elusimicrobia bacterium RIFCSPHIGHO2_02_FULL_39_36]OGR92634.1 MAG: elongation factor P [Elusimicrobia bacterium RIFCSPLOWO2_02_FULL_39_32]OGR99280.1 MAG: elongation factor P [Elusimicrobia bacterium RIFCSPLOWO2_12_FULL_39_28]
MISTADFKNGILFESEGAIYQVVWFQHHKPGKGGAVMRTKLKNVRTGSIIDQTFKSGEKFKEASMQRKKNQFLYSDERACTFMDVATYEQITIPKEKVEDLLKFLKEGLEVDALYLGEEFLALDLPASVELKVVQTVPGIKGDSVSNMTKPATLETGVELSVPLFIKEGDSIRVDTRTGEYVSRV